MTGSYMVILTAFLADNGKNLPLATGATAAFWPLSAAIAAPLTAWSLRRHRGRNQQLAPPRLPGQPTPGPARCLATAPG